MLIKLKVFKTSNKCPTLEDETDIILIAMRTNFNNLKYLPSLYYNKIFDFYKLIKNEKFQKKV